MDSNLIQTLWLWWGTIPSDFRFLMLLPFAIGGTAVLVDALQQLLAAPPRTAGDGVATAARASQVR